jgi:hypothetical protein
MSDVIDQLLDELQRAGVFASATRGGAHYPDHYKEIARPIIAKYLAAHSAPSSIAAAIREKLPLPGITLIEAERRRQISAEGWTAEHDNRHDEGEMALAAACYASPILLYQKVDRANQIRFVDPWPWDDRWDKRPEDGNVKLPNSSVGIKERIRQLSKAGALVAAELDRLLREATNAQ